MKEQQPSRAKKNWAKVKNIILSKSLAHKRKNKKFQLFKKQSSVQQGNLITMYGYQQFNFVQATPQPLYKELVNFKSEIDATGKWVWQAEQIAAYYLIHYGKRYLIDIEKEKQKGPLKIIELGAGCSGLAALSLEKVFLLLERQRSLEMLITDGQEENIQFLNKNIDLNNSKTSKAKLMKWGDQQILTNLHNESKDRILFDIILVCDCLYFTQFHKQLLLTIDSYLSNHGKAIFVNPKRGDSMIEFLSLAESVHFEYKFIEFTEQKYQAEVARIRANELFDEEKDIPYFIELYRSQNKRENK